jgi:hypothetical protein
VELSTANTSIFSHDSDNKMEVPVPEKVPPCLTCLYVNAFFTVILEFLRRKFRSYISLSFQTITLLHGRNTICINIFSTLILFPCVSVRIILFKKAHIYTLFYTPLLKIYSYASFFKATFQYLVYKL